MAAVTMPAQRNEIATMTDNDGPPTREREIQTKQPMRRDAATQCHSDDFSVEEDFAPSTINKTEEINPLVNADKFREFVKQKTNIYPNGKCECHICGEITAEMQAAHAHMLLHWGPTALCFTCGIEFEHERILRAHACANKPGYERRRYKCPHYKCGFHGISPLELYDHINQHCNVKHYQCANCRRRFTTLVGLLEHGKRHIKCGRRIRCNKFRYPNLLSSADMAYRRKVLLSWRKIGFRISKPNKCCSVCLKRFVDSKLCAKHSKICMQRHSKRLKNAKKKAKLNK